MAPLSRRRALEGCVSSLPVLLAGCTRVDSLDGPSAVTDSPTSESSTPTSALAGTTTDSYGIETPVPGECEAFQPPMPTPTPEGQDPESYPTYPSTLAETTAETFAEEYEYAYRFNEFVTEKASRGYDELQVPLGAVRTIAHRDSFVVRVDGELLFADSEQPEDAGTPAPTGEQPFVTWFYLSDRVGLRKGANRGLPEDAQPDFTTTEVIACPG